MDPQLQICVKVEHRLLHGPATAAAALDTSLRYREMDMHRVDTKYVVTRSHPHFVSIRMQCFLAQRAPAWIES